MVVERHPRRTDRTKGSASPAGPFSSPSWSRLGGLQRRWAWLKCRVLRPRPHAARRGERPGHQRGPEVRRAPERPPHPRRRRSSSRSSTSSGRAGRRCRWPARRRVRQGLDARAGAGGRPHAAPTLVGAVQPFAKPLIDEHRAAGRLGRARHDDAVRPGQAARRRARPRRRHRHPLRREEDGRYDGTIDGEFVWGKGKLRAVQEWADEHGIDLSRQLRILGQLLRHPAALGRRPPGRREPRPAARDPGAGAALAGAAPRRPPGVPKVLGVEPQQVLLAGGAAAAHPVRALRHRRRREHPRDRSGDHRREPPQLLRPDGARSGDRARSARPLPRQEGGVRRAGRRPARQGVRRHPRRARHRFRTSRWRRRPLRSRPASSWRSCRRARSRAARRSSTRS